MYTVVVRLSLATPSPKYIKRLFINISVYANFFFRSYKIFCSLFISTIPIKDEPPYLSWGLPSVENIFQIFMPFDRLKCKSFACSFSRLMPIFEMLPKFVAFFSHSQKASIPSVAQFTEGFVFSPLVSNEQKAHLILFQRNSFFPAELNGM